LAAVPTPLFEPDFDAFSTNPSAVDLDIQTQKPPEPQHTGFQALVRSTANDFVAFPRRRSTWVILGIGGAAALLVHPIDDDVNDAVKDSTTLRRIRWTIGKSHTIRTADF
jgi:hypothetical protein